MLIRFPDTPSITLFKKTTIAALVTATVALGACSQNHSKTPEPDRPFAYRLDESKLPAYIRFSPQDLDPAQSPCSDLNAYVNGQWIANNEIPGDRTRWGAFPLLAERSIGIQRQLAEQAAAQPAAQGIDKIIGDFWASGMDQKKVNELGISPLQPQLADIDAIQNSADLTNYLNKYAAQGQAPLFGLSVDADFKDAERNFTYVGPTPLGLPDKSYYLDKRKASQLAAYKKYLTRLLQLSGVTDAEAAQQARQVVALETRLAPTTYSNEEVSRDVSLIYNPKTIQQADQITPHFSWQRFFAAQGVAPQQLSLIAPKFYAEFDRALQDTDPAVWRAFLRSHAISDAAVFLSQPFIDAHYQLYDKTLGGQKEQQARWKQVLSTIEGEAGEALGQLYVKVAFPPQSKAQMQQLVGNLSQALKARIEAVSWMSPQTKQRALEKWAAFTPKIGYPDKWRDWSGLQTSRDSFYANVQATTRFNHQWTLSKIGKPVDHTEWGMTPQTVNAYYNPSANEVVFPAAILQPPFFDPEADPAFNYGGIGAVIGHEMTHGYDHQGSRFGPKGNFENWWTPQDAKNFKARTGKLVEQFNGYKVAGHPVNGAFTLGENIADLGGINTAYDALQLLTAGQPDPMVEGHTRDQNFFFNWATVWRTKITPEKAAQLLLIDPHAPAEFRANGAPSNMPSFAKAFQCKAKDPMVRDSKRQVVIW